MSFPMDIFKPAFKMDNSDVVFNHNYRFIGFRGGRARGASWTLAEAFIRITRVYTARVLCVREIQRSIKTSVHRLLVDTMMRLGVEDEYTITRDSIRHNETGSEFIFSGLWGQEQTIRSTEGIDICYMEEAQSVSKASLNALIPTVLRQPHSIIAFAMNPDLEDDAIEAICEYDNCLVIESTYLDNEHVPAPIVEEAERCKRMDLEDYNHIWLGHHNKRSNEIVFANKYIMEFVPANDEPKYYGLDFGFGGDPTVFIVASLVGEDIHIHEAKFWYESDANTIAEYLLEYQEEHGFSNKLYCDSADQGSGKILRKAGLPSISKWGKDKIEDGCRWIRAHNRVVINTELDQLHEEFQKYKYKVDPRTGDITPDLIDNWNHGIDALRYAFHRLIKRGIL